jgi:hypothetical protein
MMQFFFILEEDEDEKDHEDVKEKETVEGSKSEDTENQK